MDPRHPLRFTDNILSIHEQNPTVPVALGNLDLNRSVHAGDIINYSAVSHAKAVANTLKALRDSGDEPLVTQALVQTASSRAIAVESAYSDAEYQSPILQILQRMDQRLQHFEPINERLQHVEDYLLVLFAQTTNLRILSCNSQLQPPFQLSPLQKTIFGHKACAVMNVLNNQVQAAFAAEYPQDVIVAAAIGSVPLNFNPHIEGYQHHDILSMVVFYNETFDIVDQDNLTVRILKFQRFLTKP